MGHAQHIEFSPQEVKSYSMPSLSNDLTTFTLSTLDKRRLCILAWNLRQLSKIITI